MNTVFMWIFAVLAAFFLFFTGFAIGAAKPDRECLSGFLWFVAYAVLFLACWLVRK